MLVAHHLKVTKQNPHIRHVTLIHNPCFNRCWGTNSEGFPDLVLSWGSVLRLGGPQNHPKNEDCLGFVLGTYIPALSWFTSTRAQSKINMCWTIPTSTSNVAFSNIITVGGIQHMQITCNHQPPKDQTVYGWKPEKHKQQRRTWKTQETYVLYFLNLIASNIARRRQLRSQRWNCGNWFAPEVKLGVAGNLPHGMPWPRQEEP